MNFALDTSHYSNGSHELIALAQDNHGISYLGGNPGANIAANQAYSEPVTVDFQNTLRWLYDDTIFTQEIPINAESDIFPTDWTVFVENAQGTVVRTFGGHTTNGQIQTAWDGKDGNGTLVPVEAAYRVTIALGSLSSPPGGQGEDPGGGGGNPPAPMLLSSETNEFGVPEFLVEYSRMPDAELLAEREVAAATEHLRLSRQASLPPLPPGFGEKRAPRGPERISVREYFFHQQNAPQQQQAGGSSSLIVWKETPWVSRKTLLARQVYTGGGFTVNSVVANHLNQVRTWVGNADNDLGGFGNRDVFNSLVYALNSAGDFNALLQNLQHIDVRDFYYHGHSTGNSIGYSENSPNNGIFASTLATALGNVFQKPMPDDPRFIITTQKPFRFVFLDGCLSATGEFPEAFGIIVSSYNPAFAPNQGKKRRTFMGWTQSPRNSLLQNNYVTFSNRFWQEWMDDIHSVSVRESVDLAAAAVSGINPLPIIFGSEELTWAE